MKDFWNGLTPRNRGFIILGIVAIIIAAMVTGNFDALVGLLPGTK